DLFNPPTVKGWDADRSWINTATMLARMNFAGALTDTRTGGLAALALLQMLQDAGVRTADDALALLEGRHNVTLAPETRQPILDYMNVTSNKLRGPFAVSENMADFRLRNAMRLL